MRMCIKLSECKIKKIQIILFPVILSQNAFSHLGIEILLCTCCVKGKGTLS